MFYLKRMIFIVLIWVSTCGLFVDRSAIYIVPPIFSELITEEVPYSRMEARGDIPATPSDEDPILVQVPSLDTKIVLYKPNTNKPTQSNKLSEIEEYAIAVFSKFGLSGELARAAIRIESKTGRNMYSPTGCLGYWQACAATAKAYGLVDPFDLEESTHFAARVFKDNVTYLNRYGVPVTDIHLYMAYMIGPKHTQTVWKVHSGKRVAVQWVGAAYTQIRPNWHRGKGRVSGNAKVDFPKYYNYFTRKFNQAKDPNFQFE